MLDQQGLHIRAAFLRAVRTHFSNHDFLEVDTPIRSYQQIPESSIEPIRADGAFLLSSPELYMKRILALGVERIFQISPAFRRGERGRLHSEEFTMLEWYRQGADYYDLMDDCELLIRGLAAALVPHLSGSGGLSREFLARPWQRLSVSEAFARYASMPLVAAIAEDCFEEVLVEEVEPRLGVEAPTFLIEYPASMASLARLSEDKADVAERFELYIHGIELANAFSELTDRQEQESRFAEEIEAIADRWPAAQPIQFLAALDQLESAAGIALGLDRLLMLFWGESEIANVRSFTADE